MSITSKRPNKNCIALLGAILFTISTVRKYLTSCTEKFTTIVVGAHPIYVYCTFYKFDTDNFQLNVHNNLQTTDLTYIPEQKGFILQYTDMDFKV